MVRLISGYYSYCSQRPIAAFGMILVLFMIGSIVSISYTNSKRTGTASLLILGVVFISICSMLPVFVSSGVNSLGNDYKKVLHGMENDMKQNDGSEAGKKVERALNDMFKKSGLNTYW